MSRPYVCDICQVRAEADSFGLAPMGWFSVRQQGGEGKIKDGRPGIFTETKDICGARCLTQYAEGKADA